MTLVLSLAACGDNRKPIFEDAMTDVDADVVDARPDAPPDALMCGTAPNMMCNGTCKNTNTDNNNCGTCGTVCGTGLSCTSGICCAAGQTNCGGVCVNTTTDNNNCGACSPANGGTGDVCITTTTPPESCMNGTCCGGTNVACGSQCFDLTNTHDHCGDCATACSSSQTCSNSHCCTNGQIYCGGTCVDPTSDEANCGGCSAANGGTGAVCNTTIGELCCGSSCAPTKTDEQNCNGCGLLCGTGETCNAGKCCGAGTVSCNGTTCTNTNTDSTNCGACGNSCLAGQACSAGLCCGPGQQNCGNTCVNILDNNANCGGCGLACTGGQVCSSGTCVSVCGPGEATCPTGCANLLTNHDNCNACGTACAANAVCSNGSCVATCTTGTNCSGSCVDLQTDPSHCGSCSSSTPPSNCGPTQTCSAGLCCDAGQFNSGGICCDNNKVNTGGICCPGGFLNCNGLCMDPSLPATCGSCNVTCSGTTPNCEPDQGGITPVKCCPANTVNCGGTCVDLSSSNGNCGVCNLACTGGATCDTGICCASPTVHCSGNTCTNTQTDPANCGGCGTAFACASGNQCSAGLCCPGSQVKTLDINTPTNAPICCNPGEINCGGIPVTSCKDPTTDPMNCGGCGITCGTNQFCTVGVNGPVCSTQCNSPNTTTCGICTNTQTDPNACGETGPTACSSCAQGGACTAGLCTCPAASPATCNATCTDTGGVPTGSPGGSAGNCGGCGVMCSIGEHCSDSNIYIALANTGATAAAGVATFTTTKPHGLIANQLVYVTGVLNAAYNGTWTILAVPNATTFTVTLGSTPAASGSADDPASADPTVTLAKVGSGECCGPGLDACPGANGTAPNTMCVDKQVGTGACIGGTNPGTSCTIGGTTCTGGGTCRTTNCGACGNTCASGETCINGACSCSFGSSTCPAGGPAGCKVTTIDPTACGPNCVTCGAGAPYCVSNGCVATCPAPLFACPTGGPGGTAVCANRSSDSKNCGVCGNVCPLGQGCAAGTCRPLFPLNPDPAKCVGGGPPIIVPDGTGGTQCTGNLGAVSFTFGLCSRTNMGPLSQALYTDAFDSTKGPYRATCAVTVPAVPPAAGSSNCWPGAAASDCVGGTCVGGGVGVNGTIAPIASTSKTFHVGGDFWAFGAFGLSSNGDVTVKQRTLNKSNWTVAGNDHLYGTAWINGPSMSVGGSGHLTIDSTLYTAATPCSATDANMEPVAASKLTLNGTPKCSAAVWDNFCVGGTNIGKPCATAAQCPGSTCTFGGVSPPSLKPTPDPCGSPADLIKVTTIVEYFRDPAHNDNAAIGLAYDALANPASATRIELPCGYYYLDSIGGNNTMTLVVKGRTGLFIGGAANINVEMIFDVAPTASLDMFVGGVIRIAHPITLGSPAYPRLTRMYIGSASVAGSGPCTSNAQCGNGICTACPRSPYGPCVGTGTCTGGSSLSQAIDMSQGGFFNGLLWAGYGSFSSSNAVEMYGSIFSKYIDFSGALTVHYDRGATSTTVECPPPPVGGACESCRDCGNQACVNNACGACTNDSQCCPPLHCAAGGTCTL